MTPYQQYLDQKAQLKNEHGFTVDRGRLNPALFDWQKDLVAWALKMGRCAIFADCGLSKTPMQLEWSQQIVNRSNGNVLILTPLAVSQQTIREGEKFGVEVKRSQSGAVAGNITVTNYERLEHFNHNDFAGVVCDESSILKNFDGKRKLQITEFLKKVPYRLLCTATAAPNDYIELGTSSEALGVMGYIDMLNRYFKNDNNSSGLSSAYAAQDRGAAKWRFKHHAQEPFWRWVCSWARAVRRPSDLGYDDGAFILPPLVEKETILEICRPLNGKLFPEPAMCLKEQREERRATIKERCEMVAEKVNNNSFAVCWCNLNDEGDLLETLIPDAVQVKGQMPDDRKESILSDFSQGSLRVLVIKPKIGAFGLNWQHCCHTTFFPSHSYEQYYQGVRRMWRFGQVNPVVVDIVATQGEAKVLANLQRKSKQADQMFSSLVGYMNESVKIDNTRVFDKKEEIPSWL